MSESKQEQMHEMVQSRTREQGMEREKGLAKIARGRERVDSGGSLEGLSFGADATLSSVKPGSGRHASF